MKKGRGKSTALDFKNAVENTADISRGYKSGLKALGANSRKVIASDTTQLEGSVDIDECTRARYPNDNRWDYALAYKGEVFFVEVHTANSGEVSTVLRKLQWLRNWLLNHAPEINRLKVTNRPAFYWVQSDRFDIPPTTPQYKAAAGKGILPVKNLKLG